MSVRNCAAGTPDVWDQWHDHWKNYRSAAREPASYCDPIPVKKTSKFPHSNKVSGLCANFPQPHLRRCWKSSFV